MVDIVMDRNTTDVNALIEDELIMLRHSGEIPEIAFHQSLHFLCEDPEGPSLEAIPDDALSRMKEAVFHRYRVIVLRDMKPDNRDLSIYRGLARSIVNYQRLRRFCELEDMDISGVRAQAAEHLSAFLSQELEDVKTGRRESCINCKWGDILEFARELGVDPHEIPGAIEEICPEKGLYD